MRELLRSHSIGQIKGLKFALDAEGIESVIFDEQAPGYMGFAGKARLEVVRDEDYDRAMAVIRSLEPPRDTETPRSWKLQRWGCVLGLVGFLMLSVGGSFLMYDEPPIPPVLALGVPALVLLAAIILIIEGPRRDRQARGEESTKE